MLWLGQMLVVPELATAEARRGSVRALARDRDFWILFMGFAFVGMLAQTAVLSWLPTYLRQEFGSAWRGRRGPGALVAPLMVFSPIFGCWRTGSARRCG